MKIKLTLLLAALLVTAEASMAAASVKLTLSLGQAKTLPGLAVPLHLRLKNPGGTFTLAPFVAVRLTSPAGETFTAEWGEANIRIGDLELGLEDDETLQVAAKESLDVEVPAVDWSRPSWALDPRFIAMAGDWKVQVILFESHGEGDDTELAVSPPATLTVLNPAAGDVQIWDALRSREEWAVAEQVLVGRPESLYFPYLAGLVKRTSTLDKIAVLQRALQLHPDSPVAPWLRYSIAYFYGLESQRVFDVEHDLEKAVGLADKGRDELKRLAAGRGEWSKRVAKVKLSDHPSREYFSDLQRIAREKGRPK